MRTRKSSICCSMRALIAIAISLAGCGDNQSRRGSAQVAGSYEWRGAADSNATPSSESAQVRAGYAVSPESIANLKTAASAPAAGASGMMGGAMGTMMGGAPMNGSTPSESHRKAKLERQAEAKSPAVPADSLTPNTESYDKIVDNPFHRTAQRTAIDLFDRRRHRELRQRATLSRPKHAAAQGCRAN